jgi:hypothetical protein
MLSIELNTNNLTYTKKSYLIKKKNYNNTGLMDFFSDLFPDKNARDFSLYGLVLVPPTIIAVADPTIFRGALDIAG